MNKTPEVRHRLPYGRRLQMIDLRKAAKEENLDAIRVSIGRCRPYWLCRATEAEAEILDALRGKENP